MHSFHAIDTFTPEAVMNTADTSITDTAVRKFLKDAAINEILSCAVQTGFHLRKVAKGGSWRYRYNDATGKRRVKTIGTYPAMKAPEAAWWAREWRHSEADPIAERKEARQAAITAEQQAQHRTVRSYLDGAYTRVQSRKKNAGKLTIGRIRSVFASWLEKDMATLTKSDIEGWQIKREEAGISYSTLKRDYGALKTMVRHAFKNGALDRHPLQDVQLLAPTHDDKAKTFNAERQEDRRMLTDAERVGLLSGLDKWDKELREQRRSSRAHGKPHLPSLDDVELAHWFVPYCHLALHTGMRCGDLYGLTWKELNVQFGRLQKFPAKTLHNPDPVKIDLPLNDEIKAIMGRWWQQCGKPSDGLVFPSPITGARLSSTAHQKPWANVKRLGAMPAGLVFYSLRHNFISTMLHIGVPIFEVARMVGHKSSKMIEDSYGHLCPAAAATAMQAFGKAITQKAPEKAKQAS